MDSKPKVVAITLSILLSLTVLTCVVLVNLKTIKRKLGISPQVSATVTASVAEDETTSQYNQLGKDLKRWQSDDNFFDNPEETLAARILNEMRKVSINVVSVENDLHVYLLDSYDKVLPGFSFSILIKNPTTGDVMAEYKDYDNDGKIVISKVDADEVLVELEPFEDFIVPANPLKATVSKLCKREFIEDIEYFVRDERENDWEKEDLMQISAIESADKKRNKSIGMNENAVYGVDLSSRDGEIDFEALHEAGVRFAILRAGYRGASSGDLIEDAYFKENARKALLAGIEVGAYFFSEAVNEREAIEEASALLEITGNSTVSYPLFIRFDNAGEYSRTWGLNVDVRNTVLEAFAETVESKGKVPGVYIPLSWSGTQIDDNLVKKYIYWMSDYSKIPSYNGYFDIWQYTYDGTIKGIDKEFTFNASYIQ